MGGSHTRLGMMTAYLHKHNGNVIILDVRYHNQVRRHNIVSGSGNFNLKGYYGERGQVPK